MDLETWLLAGMLEGRIVRLRHQEKSDVDPRYPDWVVYDRAGTRFWRNNAHQAAALYKSFCEAEERV